MIIIKTKSILKWLKYGFGALFGLIVLGLVIGSLMFTIYAAKAPKLSESSLKSANSSLIYDADNNLIADLGSENRESVKTDNIPVELVNAITSIEDKRFFKHRGVDVYRIVGSAFHNLTSSSTQGGSTLDQQLIKLAYFSTKESDQTLKRKAQEAWLSIQMERKYTKQEILTFYINKVYMGNGAYGMLTAAKTYYGKDLKDLSIAQLALLAGIPQAPNQYNPYAQPEAATNRRNTVLKEMYEDGNITKKEYDTAVKTPVTDGLQKLSEEPSYPKYMDNYLKEVINQVKEKTGQDIFTAGLKVYTNVNADAQQHLYDIYNTYDYVSYPDDEMQVASTVVDVTNGKVIAQLGSRHQDDKVSFGTNQATLTDRDWGSTMKPITDYAPALESETYTSTSQRLNDSVYYWPGTDIQVYDWDRQYEGWMTMQTAIQQSRNVPAVRALEATGLDYSLKFLNGLGIDYPELNYSNAISSNNTGSGRKYGASSEKMAAAYAAFANGGTYYEPMYINKITFGDGTEQTFDAKGKQAMSATTAYMMTDMMKTVLTYGTGIRAQISGVAQAGKTGTSNYSDDELIQVQEKTGIYNDAVGTMAPDENFVGYTTQYAMAVWTGYKNRLTPIYGNGLNVATDVYRQMMTYLTNYYSEDFTMPDGVYRSGGYLYLSGTTPSYLSQSMRSNSYDDDNDSSSSSSYGSSSSNSVTINNSSSTNTVTYSSNTESNTNTANNSNGTVSQDNN